MAQQGVFRNYARIGWLLTPETPRTFIRSVAKQRMENNQHLRLWSPWAAARVHRLP